MRHHPICAGLGSEEECNRLCPVDPGYEAGWKDAIKHQNKVKQEQIQADNKEAYESEMRDPILQIT